MITPIEFLRSLVEADLEGYDVKEVKKDTFEIKKADGTVYHIVKKGGKWACDCPGFTHRGKCKHLAIVADRVPKRYPRAILEEMIETFHEMFDSIGTWEVVGSYRRRKSDWKDIDILLVCDAGSFKEKVLSVLEQDPGYVPTMAGPDIVRGRYHGYDFDINRASVEEYGPMLLYRTGSKEENLRMRAAAKSKGWKLNEHGLFDESGNRIDQNTEESIYKALGMPYKEPWERN